MAIRASMEALPVNVGARQQIKLLMPSFTQLVVRARDVRFSPKSGHARQLGANCCEWHLAVERVA